MGSRDTLSALALMGLRPPFVQFLGQRSFMRIPAHEVLFIGQDRCPEFDCPRTLPKELNILLCLLDGADRRLRLQSNHAGSPLSSTTRTKSKPHCPPASLNRSSILLRLNVERLELFIPKSLSLNLAPA